MIRNSNKHKAVGITSYCDTEEKVNVLIINISQLRSFFPEYDIVLHANYPLSGEIQKLVDSYIYEELNYTDYNKWIYYWNIITENEKYLFQKKFYYSIYDTGYSVFQQIRSLTEHLFLYDRVMLINYDTQVKEIRRDDYKLDYPFICHNFPEQKAYSLIIMDFNPKQFLPVTKTFTFENWNNPKRNDQLNEERFFDMIQEYGLSVYAYDYKVPDIIDNRPDHNKPNIMDTSYFTNYVLYPHDYLLEVYIWGTIEPIKEIEINI